MKKIISTKYERLFARRHPKTFAVLFATNFRPRPPAGHHLFLLFLLFFPISCPCISHFQIHDRQTMMSSITSPDLHFPVLEIDRRQTMMSSIILLISHSSDFTLLTDEIFCTIFFISSSLCHLTNFLSSRYRK